MSIIYLGIFFSLTTYLHSPKTLEDNSFYLFYQNRSKLLIWYLVFRFFSLYTGSLSNSFLRLFLTYSQISWYFSNNLSSSIKKDIHFVPSKSFLYALIFGRNIHKGLIFLASLYPLKYLNLFLPKGPSIKDVCNLGGRRVRQTWTNADRGRGVSQMWMCAWKKNYSYHICEIYSDNLAVCLYIKFSFCLYSIENVWNAM